jgi:hypothetical protein
MGLYPRQAYNRPDVWNWFSHSYGDGNAGSYDQTGRMDAIVRQALDVEFTNWRKYSVAGARLCVEGASGGGWATLWRLTSGGKMPGKTFPYTGQGGALCMVFGINDLGNLAGGATTQLRSGYREALRSCISRWRASTIWENDNANVVYTTGTWVAETGKFDQASSGNWRYHATTGGVITLTLPSDYDGSPIAVQFRGSPGATSGGTVTYGGTAGVTGTTVTNDVMPGATLTGVPIIKRITNLTSANASQTITLTVTANSGLVHFDCWWVEAKSPPPVIVGDVPKLTSTGYSTKYSSWNAAPALGSCDADVNALNADIATVVAEFDSMVQIAYLDAALNKDATLFSDGLHPNDLGSAKCADAIMDAVSRLTPNMTYGVSASMNTPAPKAGALRTPTRSTFWYAPEYASAGTVTGTAGTMFAMPLQITEAQTSWSTWAVEVAGGSAFSAGYQVRIGIFNDLNFTGYPDTNLQEITAAGVLNTSTSTGVKTSTGGGYIWRPDPGLYWLVLKVEVVATATTPTLRTVLGPNRYMPNALTTGSLASSTHMAWQLTGQATGTFPTTFPTGATLVASCPAVMIQRT